MAYEITTAFDRCDSHRSDTGRTISSQKQAIVTVEETETRAQEEKKNNKNQSLQVSIKSIGKTL